MAKTEKLDLDPRAVLRQAQSGFPVDYSPDDHDLALLHAILAAVQYGYQADRLGDDLALLVAATWTNMILHGATPEAAGPAEDRGNTWVSSELRRPFEDRSARTWVAGTTAVDLVPVPSPLVCSDAMPFVVDLIMEDPLRSGFEPMLTCQVGWHDLLALQEVLIRVMTGGSRTWAGVHMARTGAAAGNDDPDPVVQALAASGWAQAPDLELVSYGVRAHIMGQDYRVRTTRDLADADGMAHAG